MDTLKEILSNPIVQTCIITIGTLFIIGGIVEIAIDLKKRMEVNK